jgi:hypothetical protein
MYVGNLTAPQTNNVNVMGLFFALRERGRRSHGYLAYTRPAIHDVNLPYVKRKLGPHHIHTKLD